MKIRAILLSFFLLSGTSALLADNVGCGLGRVLMGGNSDKFSEIMAATSNQSTGSNTSAITSGTSGYQKGAVIGYNDAQQYLDENFDMVARDMARGEGEYLETFVQLMEIDDTRKLKQKLRTNFDKIYTHKDITSGEVLTNVLAVYKEEA